MISGKADLAGVVGWPVSHSRSPRLHNHWLAKYGIDGAYLPLPIAPEHFAETFRALPKLGFRGCNVTVPHKETVFALMDEVDALAERCGAVNTVVFKQGKACGSNTDVEGFRASVIAHIGEQALQGKKAVIVGAGGAARAVAVALEQLGCSEIILANRTPAKAEAIARDTGVNLRITPWETLENAGDNLVENAALVVNTTTLGMADNQVLNLPLTSTLPECLAVDIVYQPQETAWLAQAKATGRQTLNGLPMLIYQAVPGFEQWFGTRPQVDAEVFALMERA